MLKSSFTWLFVLIFTYLEVPLQASRFGYSEPNQRRWSRHHGHCAGNTQSPIAIHASKAVALHMPAIDMIGYHNLLPHPLAMVNNGHTVAISIPKLSENETLNGEFMPYIRGGKLPGEFEVEGIHFHWGDKNNRGAEHVLNDIRYTMEMHIVHRNKKYATLPEALDFADGAAVMAFFFILDEDESMELNTISHHLHLISESNQEAKMNVTFSLSSLIGDIDIDKFFMYKGSLTTPPCSEAITWVLFPDPVPISAKQISRFRQLSDTQDGVLVDNFRQLQPIGNRRIFMRIPHTRHERNAILDTEVDYKKWDWFH